MYSFSIARISLSLSLSSNLLPAAFSFPFIIK